MTAVSPAVSRLSRALADELIVLYRAGCPAYVKGLSAASLAARGLIQQAGQQGIKLLYVPTELGQAMARQILGERAKLSPAQERALAVVRSREDGSWGGDYPSGQSLSALVKLGLLTKEIRSYLPIWGGAKKYAHYALTPAGREVARALAGAEGERGC